MPLTNRSLFFSHVQSSGGRQLLRLTPLLDNTIRVQGSLFYRLSSGSCGSRTWISMFPRWPLHTRRLGLCTRKEEMRGANDFLGPWLGPFIQGGPPPFTDPLFCLISLNYHLYHLPIQENEPAMIQLRS